LVALGVALSVAVCVMLGERDGVAVPVALRVGEWEWLGVAVGVHVGLPVGLAEGVPLGVPLRVTVPLTVWVGVEVRLQPGSSAVEAELRRA
jgi:hypothetical protein